MPAAQVLLGVIGRPHGVRGLVHVTSYADPPEAIASYGALSDQRGRQFVLRWKGEDLAEIIEIEGGRERRIADRTEAEQLTNTRLFVERERLPETEDEEFYLADLVGLGAFDAEGARLGEVVAVHDFGAGASLELTGNLIVPFTRASVPVVDVAGGRVVVEAPAIIETPSPARRLLPQTGEMFASTSPACGRGRLAEGEAGEGEGKPR